MNVSCTSNYTQLNSTLSLAQCVSRGYFYFLLREVLFLVTIESFICLRSQSQHRPFLSFLFFFCLSFFLSFFLSLSFFSFLFFLFFFLQLLISFSFLFFSLFLLLLLAWANQSKWVVSLTISRFICLQCIHENSFPAKKINQTTSFINILPETSRKKGRKFHSCT